jgi:hypothetical protein
MISRHREMLVSCVGFTHATTGTKANEELMPSNDGSSDVNSI